MLTETEFKRLPSCFQEIVLIDRQLAGPIISFRAIQRLAPQRRVARRSCEILVRQPKSGGIA